MGVEAMSSVEIARDAAAVFAAISDMSRNPEWQKGMRRCVWTSDPPIGIGSTYDQVASFLGRKIVTSFEVTEFVQDQLMRIRSTVSTFPLDITRSVETINEGHCRVIAIVRGEPSGLMKLANPVMGKMVAKSVRADYRRLKEMLESE